MISFSVSEDGKNAEMRIKGEVSGKCPDIPSNLARLDVYIDSFGGDFYLGRALYHAIAEAEPAVSVAHVRDAMSAATLPMCACTEIEMGADSVVMIHGVTAVNVSVNREEALHLADELDALNKQLISIYAEASGLSSDAVAEMVAAETFLDFEAMRNAGFSVVKKPLAKRKRKDYLDFHEIAVAASADFSRIWRAKAMADEAKNGCDEEQVKAEEVAPEDAPAAPALTEERVREIVQEMLAAAMTAKAEETPAEEDKPEEDKPQEDAVAAAVKAERKRISKINSFASVAGADIIAKAIDDGMDAGAFAIAALEAQKVTAEAKRAAIVAAKPADAIQTIAEKPAKTARSATAESIMSTIFGD